MTGPLTYSVPVAGKMLDPPLSKNAAYRAAERGEIPTLRFGHLLRVPGREMAEDTRRGGRCMSKPRKNKSRVEKLLAEARRKPSPFCDDPRQLDLEDAVTQRAFANLDLEIERVRKLAGEVRS